MQPHRSSMADHGRTHRRIFSLLPACLRPHVGAGSVQQPRLHRTACVIGVAVLMSFGAMPAHAQPAQLRVVESRGPFASFVDEAATRFGIPPAWIHAVMRAESFGDTRATSPKGAIGLMQIMPETWVELRRRYHLGADPYDAHDNIVAGAAYLRELHDRYGIPGFLAAYNAGPARWENHVATGRPLPLETRAYLARLVPVVSGGTVDDAALLATVVRSWTEASLFPSPSRPPSNSGKDAVAPPTGSPSDDRRVADWTGLAPSSNGLFVALSGRTPGR